MKSPSKKPTVSKALAPDRYWQLTTLHERKDKLVKLAAPHQQALAECQAVLNDLQPKIEAAQKAAGLDPKGAYAFNDSDFTATLQDAAPK